MKEGVREGLGGASRPGGMTIRRRLLLLVAAMLAPYVLFAAYGVYDGQREAVRQTLDAGEADARRVAARLEKHVERVTALLAAAAAAVGEDIHAGAGNDVRLNDVLAGSGGAASGIGLFSLEGRILAATLWDARERASISVSDRDYFRAVLATRAPAIGAPVRARGTGNWVLLIAAPVLDARGNVRAVLAVSTSLATLDAIVASQVGGAGASVSVATDRGVTIAGAPGGAKWWGTDVSRTPHFRVARAGGTFRGEVTTLDGVRRFGASVPVANAPWQVFVGTPVDVALAPAWARLQEHVTIAALMLAAAALAAWWIARGLTLPIQRLRRGVRELARSGLAHRVSVAGGEIGELAEDINAMAAQLEESQQRLRESEARFRSLAALSSDGYWESDADDCITVVEGSVRSALGLGPDAPLGRTFWTFGYRVNGDAKAQAATLERRAPFRDVEFVRLDEGGEIAQVLLVSGVPRFGAGGDYLGYRGVARDVTERNRLEAAVRRAQARLRLVVDAVPAMIAYADRDKRFVFVNSAYREITDLMPKETVGRPVRAVLGEEVYALVEPYMDRALAGESVEFSRTHRRPDGTLRDFRIQYVPDRDAAGAVQGVIGLISDVTELKATQRSLVESEARYRELAELSTDWYWETDAAHRFAYLSPGVARNLDIATDGLIGKARWELDYLNMTAPDWAAHRAVLDAHQPFRDLRLTRRNRAGRVTYQSITGRPMFDAEGRFCGYRGVGHDVTAKTEAEIALRAERDRLQRVIETMAEGLAILDSQGRYLLVNASAERIFGARRETLLDRHYLDVPWTRMPLGGNGSGMPQDAFERLRAGGEKMIGPALYALERTDGLQRVLSHHAARIEDESGRFAGVVATFEDVTERMRAENRLQMYLASALDGYWMTDMEGRILEVNRAMCEILGRSEAELVKMSVGELLSDATEERLKAHIARLRERGQARIKALWRRKDGSLVYLEGNAAYLPVEGGRIFAFYRDVTERERADERLAESELRFRSLFELSQDGVAIHRDGVIEQANSAMAKLLGAESAQSLAGKPFLEIFAPEHREDVRARTASLGEDNVRMPYKERTLLRLDGGTIEVEAAGGAFIEGGSVRRHIVARDLTARKGHEREILDLNADLERRVEERTAELSAAYREMESFSYSVSHDLRAPLRAISGFSHILMEDFRGDVPPEAGRLLARVAQNAERMGALIDGLLEFGRLSRQPLRKQRIEPAELVREVLEELAPARTGHGVDTRIGELPPCWADRVLLKQVFANLVGNALKYSARRAHARIEVGSIVMGLGPVYYVRDNGTGFDMAYSGKLFGMFQRLHSPAEFEGNGVGLALVRRIVERHDGKVWADSAPDKGATFFFRLGAEPHAGRSGRALAAA